MRILYLANMTLTLTSATLRYRECEIRLTHTRIYTRFGYKVVVYSFEKEATVYQGRAENYDAGLKQAMKVIEELK